MMASEPPNWRGKTDNDYLGLKSMRQKHMGSGEGEEMGHFLSELFSGKVYPPFGRVLRKLNFVYKIHFCQSELL